MFKKKSAIILTAIIFFFIFPQKISAQVLINEISPSTNPEWIELYNEGNIEINLNGYVLEDGNSNHADDLTLTGTIQAKGFIVFNHNEGWLNNSGDTIKLYNNSTPSAIIDQYTYPNIDSDKTAARIPNGSETWQVTSQSTNGSSNPTPTPTPTATPTVTPTVTPTISPTVKPTPTKSPSPKPSPTMLATEQPLISDSGNVALNNIEVVSPTPLAMVLGSSSENKPRILAFILFISGALFLGYGGYLLYNQRHGKSKETS